MNANVVRLVLFCVQLDNIFIKKDGRLILGDFGEARLLVKQDGSDIPMATNGRDAERLLSGGGAAVTRPPELLCYSKLQKVNDRPIPTTLREVRLRGVCVAARRRLANGLEKL